ncbi:hypothetical protein [Dactylosporangium salmoneum]|uniref:hypothetical protein n=1 Tax=Dactylosporangium salmoneum TaxID=53361 RepID=UPI0031D0B71E
MEDAGIRAGSVFRFPGGEPLRVLVRDGAIVMYDAWWPHLKAWGLADLAAAGRGSVAYYPVGAGAGIYRSGLRRGRPAYYLWGAESKVEAPVRRVPGAGDGGPS